MADLEPWTYPMIQYYRGNVEPYKFYRSKGDRHAGLKVTKLSDAFPWAVKQKESSRSSRSPKAQQTANTGVVSMTAIVDHERKWTSQFEADRTNFNVKYDALHKIFKDGYDPMKVVKNGPPNPENNFSITESHEPQTSPSDRPALSTTEKAKKNLERSRHDVQLHEMELKQAIPDSERWHVTRRACLACAIRYNYHLCQLHLASEGRNSSEKVDADHAEVGSLFEIVNVVVQQVEELVQLMDEVCEASAQAQRVLKDYPIALQDGVKALLRLDGSQFGWSTVCAELRCLADAARKAERAVLFLARDEDTLAGLPVALPLTLRLHKRRGKHEALVCDPPMGASARPAKREPRSRIDEYEWQSIPEVAREALKQKKEADSLTRKEMRQHVLTQMIAYKQIHPHTGTRRMRKPEEKLVHETLRSIAREAAIQDHRKDKTTALVEYR